MLSKIQIITAKQFVKPISALIVVPIAISYLILAITSTSSQQNTVGTYKTVIIQPNIDPYNDKFYFAPEKHLHNLLVQLGSKLDSTIDFLVLPETYLTEDFTEGR
jgi:apolipoprotein N-acyltransferase